MMAETVSQLLANWYSQIKMPHHRTAGPHHRTAASTRWLNGHHCHTLRRDKIV